jgi:hypothetical protein
MLACLVTPTTMIFFSDEMCTRYYSIDGTVGWMRMTPAPVPPPPRQNTGAISASGLSFFLMPEHPDARLVKDTCSLYAMQNTRATVDCSATVVWSMYRKRARLPIGPWSNGNRGGPFAFFPLSALFIHPSLNAPPSPQVLVISPSSAIPQREWPVISTFQEFRKRRNIADTKRWPLRSN